MNSKNYVVQILFISIIISSHNLNLYIEIVFMLYKINAVDIYCAIW